MYNKDLFNRKIEVFLNDNTYNILNSISIESNIDINSLILDSIDTLISRFYSGINEYNVEGVTCEFIC